MYNVEAYVHHRTAVSSNERQARVDFGSARQPARFRSVVLKIYWLVLNFVCKNSMTSP
jgi:hypothetical protein